MLRNFFALISGLIFGIGLVISSMVDPQKVIGFLDITGQWDPTLAFVMGGALLVYLPAYFGIIKLNPTTLLKTPCDIPTNNTIDKRLIVGASLFGIGWGLSGICPGPALVNIVSLAPEIGVFVALMIAGMWLGGKLSA